MRLHFIKIRNTKKLGLPFGSPVCLANNFKLTPKMSYIGILGEVVDAV